MGHCLIHGSFESRYYMEGCPKCETVVRFPVDYEGMSKDIKSSEGEIATLRARLSEVERERDELKRDYKALRERYETLWRDAGPYLED